MKDRSCSTIQLEEQSETATAASGPKAVAAGKRLVFLALSLCWLGVLTACNLFRRPRCIALYYHGVSAEGRERFERQMEALVRATVPVSPADFGLPVERRAYSMVTFDDGFRSVVDNALPALKRLNITAAMFVPSGSIGERPGWLAGMGHRDYREERVLSAEEIAIVSRDMIVGSHTRSHRRLAGLRASEIRLELEGSKLDLERMTGREVELLSFPHGDHDARVLRIARETGYKRAFSIEPRSFNFGGFTVDRFLADPDDWPIEFALKIRGAYSWLWPAHRMKRWLGARLRRSAQLAWRRRRLQKTGRFA